MTTILGAALPLIAGIWAIADLHLRGCAAVDIYRLLIALLCVVVFVAACVYRNGK
jgi:hypothetical protein